MGWQVNLSGTLFLTGSRVDDRLKGGDLDLLLVCGSKKSSIASKYAKEKFLSELKMKIGDRRIDLTICAKTDLLDNPILMELRDKAMELASR